MPATKLFLQLVFIFTIAWATGFRAQAEDAIQWRKDLEEAKQDAAQSGRLVLLHFYGSSCPPCAKLDKEVFSQKLVADALQTNYVPVKVNVDHSMAIASAYNVTSWPTDVVITPTGQIVAKFISPQGVQPYLSRMDQIAVATRDQAAAGMVKMGPNGTNPYSNIAIPAAGVAAGAVNNNYAAPTQYQEAVAQTNGSPYANQSGSPYAPQANSPYGNAGPGQAPYNSGSPYASANPAAAAAPQTEDRYSNAAGGDRYATPQYGGGYDAAVAAAPAGAPASGDRYATPQYGGGYDAAVAAAPGAAPTYGDRYATGAGSYGADNAGAAANYGATQNSEYQTPANVNSPHVSSPAPGAYAPPAGPQMQGNPYAQPTQDPYANVGNSAAANPPAQSGYDPNQRYGVEPGVSSPVTTGPEQSPVGAPQYGADNRYNSAPPQYNASPPAPVGNGYNPAVDYSQAPAMSPGLSAPVGPSLGAPTGGAPPVAPGAPPTDPRSQAAQTSGNSAFGLDAFCPVALAEQQRWVQGDKAWGAVHLGKTYLFISQENQQKFLARPDAFAPVLSGNDPVLVIERNIQLPGNRSHGVFYRDHVYLFSSEETLTAFGKDPERYANGVRQAMQQRATGADQRR